MSTTTSIYILVSVSFWSFFAFREQERNLKCSRAGGGLHQSALPIVFRLPLHTELGYLAAEGSEIIHKSGDACVCACTRVVEEEGEKLYSLPPFSPLPSLTHFLVVNFRSCWRTVQSTLKSSRMRQSTNKWSNILSFILLDRRLGTLVPFFRRAPSASENLSSMCCFTSDDGFAPASCKPWMEEEGWRERQKRGRQERRGGRER